MATKDEQAPDVAYQQREVMCRVLANTVVKQLVESGCDSGQLIDFAGEVLRCITDRGFEGSSGEPGGQAAPGEDDSGDLRRDRRGAPRGAR